MRDINTSPDKKIENFWHQAFKSASEDKINIKEIILPLARIKRLMKVEEGVRMVASEVPVIFSLVAEKFVEELTLRSWINTEENKRRILQLNDISVAVKTSEMYDFLIYIIPRSDISSVFDRMITSNEVKHRIYQQQNGINKLPLMTNNRYGFSSEEFENTMFKSNEQLNINSSNEHIQSRTNSDIEDSYNNM